MIKRKDMGSTDWQKKENPLKNGRGSGKSSSVASYISMRRYCLDRSVKAFWYDEFDDILPSPKSNDEPRGPKIIIRKGGVSGGKQSEEAEVTGKLKGGADSVNDSRPPIKEVDLSEVKRLEKQLVQLIGFMCLDRATKRGKNSRQDWLKQIYYKIEELIKIDPLKAKAPLSIELQEAYDKLKNVV